MTKDDVPEFGDEHLTTADGPMWMELPLVSAAGLDDGVSEGGSAVVKLEEDEDIAGLVSVKAAEEVDDQDIDPTQMVSVVASGGNLIRANHATLQALLSTPISANQVFATAASHEGGALQVFALPQASEMVGLGSGNTVTAAGGGLATIGGLGGEQRFVQMIPTGTDLSGLATKYIGLIAIGNPGVVIQDKGEIAGLSGLEMVQAAETGELTATATADNMAAFLMPPPPVPDRSSHLVGGLDDRLMGDLSKYGGLIGEHTLPPNCPAWATQLKNCEKIGDSFRGYVSNEVDLDLILTLHKQHTNSFWGTRQSPSPAKASTRLMWKSQYVPFDGIPFVNAGSRAVVMECQFGPRRKGTLGKRSAPSTISTEFKQTCPARIYIKKVRKFPTHAVKLDQDKKSIRLAMDKAFHELREQGLDTWGEERFYVQLPTEKAHDYHDETTPQRTDPLHPQLTAQASPGYNGQLTVTAAKLTSGAASTSSSVSVGGASGAGVVLSEQSQQRAPSEARIHPAVLDKLRQLVAGGETKLYAIRKQLRRFVVRELFHARGQVPERHDLTMFPTVNDLKNHIHQALKDIESGVLPLHPSSTCTEGEPGSSTQMENTDGHNGQGKSDLAHLWAGGSGGTEEAQEGGRAAAAGGGGGGGIPTSTPMPETVTVTLTQNPGEDGHHIISRIETHLSDGTTQVSTTLTPETAQLLSRLHPGLFPAGSLLQLDNTHPNTTGQGSNPGHSATQADEGAGNQASVSTSAAGKNVHNSSRSITKIEMSNVGKHRVGAEEISSTPNPQHVMAGVMVDPSHHLAGFVSMDPDTASSLSRMMSAGVEDDEDESATKSILVSQQSHGHAEEASIQAEITSLHIDNHQGIAAFIAANAGADRGSKKLEGSVSGPTLVASMERATTATSASLPTVASSMAAHHLGILNAMDPATISQMVQSGAAQLSIVPGHPNTLALVPTDPGATSLGLVASHEPSDLDASEAHHGHLNLDNEHLMMDRPTSSLEEDHEKLSQDKISLHITTDQEIGMAKLENQVSNL
ncbi:calcium-responsive transcription factor-like [Plakobranchus ocellatus]|uniref:Calcium-responsive transcription factor-like n=1 Tax=Plakobranchus ocellatus TaxID=259542 RepID=A0AAV4CBB9_9GAST|nr:calcium-responsive transcription factor-like [Plakobranchus ocellatus]